MLIHPTASVSPTAEIGRGTRIWHWTQIGEDARVGEECIVGSGVYIDRQVVVGSRVKIQTGAQLYHGSVIEDGAFIGPLVCLTNDKYPRAITPAGRLKTDADWEVGTIHVGYGASLGAGAIVLPGVTIGRFAMVGAGAVVAASVPDHGLVIGTPARLVGYACACGHQLCRVDGAIEARWGCAACGSTYLEGAAGQLTPESTRALVLAGESEGT